ncbi:hypothetical protein [Aquimarina algicola]|uniref:Lipoprotein n=1 Tax=Aquimarina algicola TaxID=2589995 RepID=A0A504JK63_9FLAO|nr:hypothetical protein [Aquimarina algicola]TPN86930.1 hypothetical protein FHK87_04825 [Aquimarina algicola]
MRRFIMIIAIFLSFISCQKNNDRKKPEETKKDSTIVVVPTKGTPSVKTENYKTKDLLTNLEVLRNEHQETNLIIIGGGKNKKEAEEIKNKYLAKVSMHSQIRGIPTIALSDTIQGLNPGFYITTIGCVNNNFKTQMILRYINQYLKGAYSRKIKLNKNQFNSIGSKIDFKPNKRDDLDMKDLIGSHEESGDCSFENYQTFCLRVESGYQSGISEIEEQYYEGNSKEIKYPLEHYSFHEVLDYIVSHQEAFAVLLEYDNLEDLEEKKYSENHDYDQIRIFDDLEIEIEGSHYSEHLYIEDKYIIYSYASGV